VDSQVTAGSMLHLPSFCANLQDNGFGPVLVFGFGFQFWFSVQKTIPRHKLFYLIFLIFVFGKK
jgi:hypothetical protein